MRKKFIASALVIIMLLSIAFTISATNNGLMNNSNNPTSVPPPVLSFDIFNNGQGGSPSRPNASLAQSGIIRMWTQLNGVNSVVPYADLEVTAQLPNGQCAMRFVRINNMWANPGNVNLIDVVTRPAEWGRIYLTATLFGQTVEVVLVNNEYVPPVQATTITVNFPGMYNVRVTYNVTGGTGWVNVPGRHDNYATFELPMGHERIDRIQVFCSRGGSNFLVHPITVTPNQVNVFDVPVIPLRVVGVNSLSTVQVGIIQGDWVVSMHNVQGPVEITDDIVFNVFRNTRNYTVRLTNPGQNPSINLVVGEGNVVYNNGVYEMVADFEDPFYYVTVPTGITGVRVAGPNWIIPAPGANAGDQMWFLPLGGVGRLMFRYDGTNFDFPNQITFDGTCIFCQVDMCDLHVVGPVLTTTVYAEGWRDTINIRFFLDDELAELPLEDIVFIVDDVEVENIRDFTVNIADWQTSTSAVFINKQVEWQHIIVHISAYGQTVTHEFTNNMFVTGNPVAPLEDNGIVAVEVDGVIVVIENPRSVVQFVYVKADPVNLGRIVFAEATFNNTTQEWVSVRIPPPSDVDVVIAHVRADATLAAAVLPETRVSRDIPTFDSNLRRLPCRTRVLITLVLPME